MKTLSIKVITRKTGHVHFERVLSVNDSVSIDFERITDVLLFLFRGLDVSVNYEIYEV